MAAVDTDACFSGEHFDAIAPSSNESHALPQSHIILPNNDLAMSSSIEAPHAFSELYVDLPSAPSSFDFNVDWGQEFPTWLMESRADIENVFSPFPLEHIQRPLSRTGGRSIEYADPTDRPATDVEHIWFSQMHLPSKSHPTSGTVTPAELQGDVDETYRQKMRQTLQIRSLDTTLPSADFINICIRSYFVRFHPKFPIIHVPTFRPSKTNSMLLLSICSIGSLITSPATGLAQGKHIWEILNKAVLAKWERFMVRDTSESISVIQAALLGQTFALLSGDPKHLAAAEAFHGTIVSWARRLKMLRVSHTNFPQLQSLTDSLEAKWQDWAREEQLIRISLAMYIHDAELTNLFHHEPLFRTCKRVPCAAADELFMASTPEKWLSRLQQRNVSRHMELSPADTENGTSELDPWDIHDVSRFTMYAQLEYMTATIVEERLAGRLDDEKYDTIAEDLVRLYTQYSKHQTKPNVDSHELDILWHLCFVSLATDFDLLERIIGRDGPQTTEADQKDVRIWAASLKAQRAVVHIRWMRQKLEALPIGAASAIHVPRAIFCAALCWFCAFRYRNTDEGGLPLAFEFPELTLLDQDRSAMSFTMPKDVETKEMLCHLANLLRRLGHWEIARKFAAIIEALLPGILT